RCPGVEANIQTERGPCQPFRASAAEGNRGCSVSAVRVRMICLVSAVAVLAWLISGSTQHPATSPIPGSPKRELAVRIGVETLRNPYWYAEHGYREEASQFWDRDHWDRVLRGWAAEGYTHVLYWVEPWNEHAWQTFLVRHTKQPEARGLSDEQS